MKRNKDAQISMEYLIIVGFVTFIIVAILGIALFYSGSIKDRIKINQVNNYANKIISTAESVFYAGSPSRATITCYLPQSVEDVEILGNDLILTVSTSSGINKIAFPSKVPSSEGSETLSHTQGLKKIKLQAEKTQVVISQV